MAIQTTLSTPGSSSPQELEFSLSGPSSRFDFSGFEVPEHLDALGGEQITALHQFVGGRRVIQTFGPIPFSAITWSGILLGTNTFVRAFALDALRRSGQQLVLTYGSYKYQGVLKSVKFTPGNEGYIPYSCSFQPDTDVSVAPELQDESLVQPVETSVAQAQAIAEGLAEAYTAAGANQMLLAQMQDVLANLSSLSSAITSAGSMISNMSPTVLAQQIVLFTENATALSSFALNNTPNGADITDVANASNDAFAAIQLYSYIQQIANLLAAAAAPSSIFYATVSNPNLFVLAAQYYGDPDKWSVIADANGLTSAFNVGVFTLVIPL